MFLKLLRKASFKKDSTIITSKPIFACFLFLFACFFFLLIAPNLSKPALAAWTITDPPTWSGSNVSFHWDSPANTATSVVIVDWDDPLHTVVWDSLAEGASVNGLQDYTVSTSSWHVGPGIPIDGNFAATLIVWGTLQSNRVIFTIPGAPPGGNITLTATANGNSVSFVFSPNANVLTALLIYKDTDPVNPVKDSGSLGNIPAYTWDGTGQPSGGYHAQVFVGNVPFSNVATFTLGGVSWNNPGPPPPPFNLMDVFQPAKRFGSFGQLASDVLLILVSLAGSLALIFIVISGFKFVTSSGDEKKLASARATLTYAIIGIVVVILAFVVVQILQYFLQSSIPIT